MPYRSPVADFGFIFEHVVPLAPLAATGRYAEADAETVAGILAEAGRMSDEVLAPLQRAGDQVPARLENGVLRSSPGYDKGYGAIAGGGWIGLTADPAQGGMGLPQAVNMAVNDMMSGACLSLQLKPLLTQGQIEALEHHADPAMQALYLPRLISGEWSGTMNLTEPQAGSDVGALRAKAEPNGDGSYAVTGQKIYISWGDSDLVSNVCHLVLARLPDAAEGTRGISLFMVPKYLPDAEGNPGAANDLRVVSLEHKMGLHGSPTCVMAFEGATGWLVGAPHKGMAAMFTMMNNARLAVGVQGIGVAEAACQKATEYAAERSQMGAIIQHADVRRMLATMRAEVFAARCIALDCATALDMARATGSAEAAARGAALTPIAKSWGTAVGIAVSDMGVQVHGGMGFIEETGAAQFFRDVRVTAIYEGTNGIQAMDLVGRKLADGGTAVRALIAEIAATAAVDHPLAPPVAAAAAALSEATEALLARAPAQRFGGADAYLRGFARALGAQYHLRAALAEGAQGPRTRLARHYITRLLPGLAGSLAEALADPAALEQITAEDLMA
ncbi:acyl-CoA dehydrogenase family protein [Frigidibacter sp. MR17.24]|uniref:acyl-CoA dehydrogenase family protein n=1 Tax=Frigidibacter sp. MR17.24 TaxID=3127345 RepID=UPI003012DB6A